MKRQNEEIFFHLISDKGFKDWVLQPNDKRSLYWTNWIHEHPESSAEISQAQEFIKRISFTESRLDDYEMEQIFKGIISKEATAAKLRYEKGPTRKWYFGWSQLGRVAAILVFFLVTSSALVYLSKEGITDFVQQEAKWLTVHNKRGERQTVNLSDGSTIILNYESTLRYPEVFIDEVRTIELNGEAFFEVTKDVDRPFIVMANGLKTEVLGTSFNVQGFEADHHTTVSLVTGSVKVNSETNKSKSRPVFLNPGEQLILNRHSDMLEKKSFDVEKVTSWKDGVVIFDNTSFTDFISKMEKWYGVDFQIYGTPGQDWNINGRYQNERIDDVLKGLNFVYGIKYEINGKNITLEVK